jgi:polygalacturonase
MTDETAVIQHAINSCPKGGVVELTRGTYISGSLYLKSDMTLKIDHGATIKGTENDGEYPIINTRIGGLEMPHPAALINAIDCQHTCITGEGTIDGSGKKWWDYFWKMRQQYGRGIDFKVLRPRLVCFTRCQDSSISKLTLQNPPFWTLHLLYSNHIRVDGLTIRAPRKAPSSDGIDVDSSNDISIAHCDIACDDDNISVKAGRDADGLRVNKPSENITIRDCHFGAGGGVAMGSETAGGIRHVLVDHCTFDGSGAAVRIKSMPGCGGVVEDITYQNITAKNVRSPIEINLTWGGDDWKKSVDPKFAARVPAALGTPHVRNIHILNLSATDCPTAGIIYGLPNSPISDVQFVNVHISSDRGLGISHTDNLNFNGLTIQTKIGPAIVLHSTSKK